jgi:capsule biosynthesis phosphatase
MRCIILCGGNGTRLSGLDFPKPLCTIRGKSLLYHVLDNLPKEITDVTILYNHNLEKFQFQRTISHACGKLKKIDFVRINIDTRGPVETAYSGLQTLGIDINQPVLFIDNDTINRFALSSIQKDHLNLGTFYIENKLKPYSFVSIGDDNKITQICEKIPISNTYCTGLYYFPSVDLFYHLSNILFESNSTKSEYYMSDLYDTALRQKYSVFQFLCDDSIALGTKADIEENISRVKQFPMRICFDIDNTILTNSFERGSDEGIEPIPHMVEMLRTLHKEGNTIVLSTARGMQTCESNIGKAGKRGMLKVLTKLEEYNIPYDEIYFGKPWADVYIDDKAWNQYTNPYFSEFMFNYGPEKSAVCIPRNCSNNENTLLRDRNIIIKRGPKSSLEGEIYFYKKVSGTSIHGLFPIFLGSKETELSLEFIHGRTVSHLFRNHLLTRSMLHKIYMGLTRLHTFEVETDTNITRSEILDNYIGKLESRIQTSPEIYGNLYRLDDVVKLSKEIIMHYIEDPSYKITNVIHGDPWFDNMIFTENQEIKFLDMKGKVNSVFTLKGDAMTDYAKLYQSILGFDMIMNGEIYQSQYEKNCRQWLSEVLPFPIDDPVFECVTAICILKTFSFFSDRTSIPSIYKSLGKLKLFTFLQDT